MRCLAGLMLRNRFVIQSEITTFGSRGLLELTVHIALTNKKKVVEVAFRYGGPKDRRVNLHTPPLLKAALSCQEQSHLHTVMVCFSVNTGNEICEDVGYKLSRGNNQSVRNIRAEWEPECRRCPHES